MFTLFQFGTITPPSPLATNFNTLEGGGLGQLVNLGIKTLIVVGGLYALLNFLLAGYAFLSAGDDPKKMAGAWAKIWQTALGLVILGGAFVLAAIFGYLIFGDPRALIYPSIPTP